MELLNSFSFVKTPKMDPSSRGKKEVSDGLRKAVREVNSVKEGKKKAIPARKLLNEL